MVIVRIGGYVEQMSSCGESSSCTDAVSETQYIQLNVGQASSVQAVRPFVWKKWSPGVVFLPLRAAEMHLYWPQLPPSHWREETLFFFLLVIKAKVC